MVPFEDLFKQALAVVAGICIGAEMHRIVCWVRAWRMGFQRSGCRLGERGMRHIIDGEDL